MEAAEMNFYGNLPQQYSQLIIIIIIIIIPITMFIVLSS